MTPLAAELTAVKALSWIASDDELAGAFLAMSGAGADEIRERAADPEFLGFVLDFMLSDERALIRFCEAEGLSPRRRCAPAPRCPAAIRRTGPERPAAAGW